MRTASLLVFALLGLFTFTAGPTSAAERECRPSLSNFWHCPGDATPERRTAKPIERACRRSLSNGYHCPGDAPAPTTKAEKPAKEPAPSKTTERGCRPSLSNGYNCGHPTSSGTATKDDQYTTEASARAHCFAGTVVWANTHSNIYHFAGTHSYGNTKVGAYMCENDALSDGMRAALNETHP